MREIRLHGKHAVGEHQVALVDDVDYHWLTQWRWKAKPNGRGNNVYAVRNAWVDGKCVHIRMHREILGLSKDDPRDTDHINHNALDNRRENLRACSRSENILNAKTITLSVLCLWCDDLKTVTQPATATTSRVYCSRQCGYEAAKARAKFQIGTKVPKPQPWCSVFFHHCKECKAAFTCRTSRQAFCGSRCRYNWKTRGRDRDTPVALRCKHCQSLFDRPLDRRFNNTRYCSQVCSRQSENARRRTARSAA